MVLKKSIVTALLTYMAATAYAQNNLATENPSIVSSPILCFKDIQRSIKFLPFFEDYTL